MTEQPLAKKLLGHQLVLASASPRRKQFFKDMGLNVDIRLQTVEELYPEHLKASEIPIFLAELKAAAFEGMLESNEILITSDTVVWHKNQSLAKAENHAAAKGMLQQLSGSWHEVITAVCFTTSRKQITKSATTKVKFAPLSDAEIDFYITNFAPFDKAGAYGIQEWIGAIGVEAIEGNYNNVVGLPTHLVYKTLMNMVS
ncbi:MAG: Maf family nucleotide pyrophosphatase [Bacteroidota bacterium]